MFDGISPSQEVPPAQRGICRGEEEVFLFIMNLFFFFSFFFFFFLFPPSDPKPPAENELVILEPAEASVITDELMTT